MNQCHFYSHIQIEKGKLIEVSVPRCLITNMGQCMSNIFALQMAGRITLADLNIFI